jgi:hypothetical protein
LSVRGKGWGLNLLHYIFPKVVADLSRVSKRPGLSPVSWQSSTTLSVTLLDSHVHEQQHITTVRRLAAAAFLPFNSKMEIRYFSGWLPHFCPLACCCLNCLTVTFGGTSTRAARSGAIPYYSCGTSAKLALLVRCPQFRPWKQCRLASGIARFLEPGAGATRSWCHRQARLGHAMTDIIQLGELEHLVNLGCAATQMLLACTPSREAANRRIISRFVLCDGFPAPGDGQLPVNVHHQMCLSLRNSYPNPTKDQVF